jgi:riboflavin kinase / FMN adenylyltransferase
MQIIRHGLEGLEPQGRTALTMGSFDGIHRAHKALLERLFESARRENLLSTLLTFSPHPRLVLGGGAPSMGLLTDVEERVDILRELGLDRLVILKFTSELAAMSARAFICEVLKKRIGCEHLLIGQNHAFGRKRSGDRHTLRALSTELNFSLDVFDPVILKGKPVSSTRIREELLAGRVEQANELLGRPYTLQGSVVRGHSRGTSIGFPTANLRLRTPEKLLPARGVYAVTATVSVQGRELFTQLQGMMNLGGRPTFGEAECVPEVHFFDFDETIYGLEMELAIHHRIRDIIRFDSREELVRQLNLDLICIQERLGSGRGTRS